MRKARLRAKILLSSLLTLAMVVTMLVPATAQAAGKAVTVGTQKELDAALADNDVTKIAIKAKKSKTLTIPAGDYTDVALVVEAENVKLNNYGTFKVVKIRDAKKYMEYATGNTVKVTDTKLTLGVEKGASVEALYLSKDDAENRVVIRGVVEKITVSESSVLDVTVHGTLETLNLQKTSDVEINGTTEEIIVVNTGVASYGTTLDSSVTVDVRTKDFIKINLSEGAEGSDIIVKTDEGDVLLTNHSKENVLVEEKDGTVHEADHTETVDTRIEKETTPVVVIPPYVPTPTPTPTPDPVEYTVTFDSVSGSAIASQTVEEGKTAVEPTDPTLAGYEFKGWYNGETVFDFGTTITANITLTAKWEYDITAPVFDATDATVIVATSAAVTWMPNSITATDNVDGTLTVTPAAIMLNGSEITLETARAELQNPGKSVVVTYVAKDYNGNTTEALSITYKTAAVVTKVSNTTELKNALTAAGLAGASDSLITLEENATIDLSGQTWTPVKVDGYHGADIVTIDGNGATITGLTAPLFAGGFAGGSGIVIKNLTIKDSNIVSTNTIGSGAFIESVDSMDLITLENCHLINSTVTGGDGSRTGGLIGWTAGYNNVNDGPVKTYVTIENCSVVGCTITCDGSVGGLYGHAGNNAWTFSTVKNCTVTGNTLTSTDDGGWRVGVVVGTANVGELAISGITESGNMLTQTGKTAPEGQSNLYGRFVPGTTGKLTIDGVAIQ